MCGQHLADLLRELGLLGEFARLELRIHQITVDRELETTAARRNQFERCDFLFIGFEQPARQTDGLRLVVSHRAITKLQLHIGLLFLVRPYFLPDFPPGFFFELALARFLETVDGFFFAPLVKIDSQLAAYCLFEPTCVTVIQFYPAAGVGEWVNGMMRERTDGSQAGDEEID